MPSTTQWSYNGSTTLTTVSQGLTPGTVYNLSCNDPGGSTPVTGTADGSGNLTLSVTDISGMSAGQTNNFLLVNDSGPYDPQATGIFKYGTSEPSGTTTDEAVSVTWAYDGNGSGGSVSVTYTSTNSVDYGFSVVTGPSGSGTFQSTTGDGSVQTLTIPDLVEPDAGFVGFLFNIDTGDGLAIRIFTPGTADSGRSGLAADTGGGGGGDTSGRVLIAFDDGPLEPSPTWTRIDGGDAPFPQNFVSGYDVDEGRQTLLAQTDTGTATVYVYDRDGLFDPRNVSSPYFGKLDGKQILLQLWDPVAAAWEDQFRGHIDDITWTLDGSAPNAAGQPINAAIQLDCVDIFDYLAGYGLTPGLDGITPRVVPSGTAGGPVPVGFEDGVYYAATVGTTDDRIIQILTDAGVDPTRYLVASGNVHIAAVKYDPDESALQALRDAADADLPFIANIYCDRHGMFAFRGRYSRFYPDDVAAEAGSTWDFTRWSVGDETAILADPTRAQMRVLAFGRNRSDLINVGIGYPQNLQAADMPDQVFADTTSITDYGKHSAPPMSDLLLDPDTTQPVTGFTGKNECFHYAKLLVENKKDPRENITSLQVKAIRPDDDRAATTWAILTRSDISHIVNVAVGYPGGTGFTGESPADDYYIEGRHLRVRPLNPTHDYVELDLDVTPAVWSMDTHDVFPNPFGDETPSSPTLTASFTAAV